MYTSTKPGDAYTISVDNTKNVLKFIPGSRAKPEILSHGKNGLNLRTLEGVKEVQLLGYRHKIIFEVLNNSEHAEFKINGTIIIETGKEHHTEW